MRLWLILLLAVLLPGCAAQGWQPRDTDWRAESVSVQFVPDPGMYCPNPPPVSTGCTRRNKQAKTAVIYVRHGLRPEVIHCVLYHEWGHAMGLNHPPGAPYMCGPERGL